MGLQDDATKWIFATKSFWGIAITTASTFIPVISGLLGWGVTATDVAQIGTSGTALIEGVGQVVGLALTFIGLVSRKLPVRWSP